MAIYEYYCPTCRDRFERRRPMSEALVSARCDKGHEAERALSAFALTRNSGMEFGGAAGAGGCCGGGACACASAN